MAKPSARDRILDAYQDLLTEQAPATVTLDSVAARAKVSKGGLLYHFGSKEALLDGLLERLITLNAEDIEQARAAPEGAIRYFLRSSVTDATEERPLYRVTVATLPLAVTEPKVCEAWAACSKAWHDLLAEQIDDPVMVHLLGVIGDGLYLRAALGDPSAGLSGKWDVVLTKLDVRLKPQRETHSKPR